MANQYYTPSPFVNFNYEPNPSEGQRIVDTMKKIKKEKQEDDEIAQKAKSAEQAYTAGTLQLRAAQIKMDEVEKDLAIDQGASQAYNAIRASGGTEADGIRAGIRYEEENGGWDRGKKARGDARQMREDIVNDYIKMPTAQGLKAVTAFLNFERDPSEQMTEEEVKQSLTKLDYTKVNNEGDFMVFDPITKTAKTVNLNSPETMERLKTENKEKIRQFNVGASMEQGRIGASNYATRTSAENARLASEGRETKADKDREYKYDALKSKTAYQTRNLDIQEMYKKGQLEKGNTMVQISQDKFELDEKKAYVDSEIRLINSQITLANNTDRAELERQKLGLQKTNSDIKNLLEKNKLDWDVEKTMLGLDTKERMATDKFASVEKIALGNREQRSREYQSNLELKRVIEAHKERMATDKSASVEKIALGNREQRSRERQSDLELKRFIEANKDIRLAGVEKIALGNREQRRREYQSYLELKRFIEANKDIRLASVEKIALDNREQRSREHQSDLELKRFKETARTVKDKLDRYAAEQAKYEADITALNKQITDLMSKTSQAQVLEKILGGERTGNVRSDSEKARNIINAQLVGAKRAWQEVGILRLPLDPDYESILQERAKYYGDNQLSGATTTGPKINKYIKQ